MTADTPDDAARAAARELGWFTDAERRTGHAFVAGASWQRAQQDAMRVEITNTLGVPTTCKVWRGDVQVFDGVSRSALMAGASATASGALVHRLGIEQEKAATPDEGARAEAAYDTGFNAGAAWQRAQIAARRDEVAVALFAWDTEENLDQPTWESLDDEQREVWLSAAAAVLAALGVSDR